MKKKLALEKENSEDLGFAYACLIYGAISFDEFLRWAYYVIENYEVFPDYFLKIIDLQDFHELRPMDVFGFTPVWSHTRRDMKTIMAIGFKRGIKKSEDIIRQSDSQKFITTDTRILSRFNRTFPFLLESSGFSSPS